MKNDVLFEKSKQHLAGVEELLKGHTADTVTAKTLDDVATLLLVSTRLLLRLAGRIDVPRPDPVVVVKKKPRPKPVEHAPKSANASARSPKAREPSSDVVFDVTMSMDQGNSLLGSPGKKKLTNKLPKKRKKLKGFKRV